ncbi:hypothetical protein [Nonomuraea insulae]|uniref:Uncharacterized protein n=1 Tax=Nonomuraea insulae TaxID=1616787 RepID=A0ABW1CCJ8_9ACTN
MRAKTEGSDATLAIPRAVVTLLRQHKAQHAAEQLAATMRADPGLVFTTSVGTSIEPNRA